MGVARLGCPAWSCSIRETDHTPAMTMHSTAGAEARGLRCCDLESCFGMSVQGSLPVKKVRNVGGRNILRNVVNV